jgi:hypothetical protein
MPEKTFEQNFYNEQKNEGEKRNLKYSLDLIESDEAVKAEIELTRKEINEIQKLLEEENFGREIHFLKKSIRKEGFKKTVVSPFIRDFHVIPSQKENTCFVPAKSIPRLKNLLEITPELANSEGGDNIYY